MFDWINFYFIFTAQKQNNPGRCSLFILNRTENTSCRLYLLTAKEISPLMFSVQFITNKVQRGKPQNKYLSDILFAKKCLLTHFPLERRIFCKSWNFLLWLIADVWFSLVVEALFVRFKRLFKLIALLPTEKNIM